LTPLVAKYYKLADSLGLDHPLGRAVYLANRHYNGGLKRYRPMYPDEEKPNWEPDALRSIKTDTAQRWEWHWNGGGSIKALKYSEKEWIDIRQCQRIDQRHLRPLKYPPKGRYQGCTR
jgi:hypothetical protein